MRVSNTRTVIGITVLVVATSLSAATDISKGMVVLAGKSQCWGGTPLYLHYISTGQSVTLDGASAYGPAISPDGKQVAYGIWGDGLYIINTDKTGRKKLASFTDGGAEPTATWCTNGYIYYAANSTHVRRIKATGGRPEIVLSNSTGGGFHKLTVSADGSRCAWTQVPPVANYKATLPNGSLSRYRSNCQGSVSSDGKYLTWNHSGHHSFTVVSWATNQDIATINYSFSGNAQTFSRHVPDVVCFQEQCGGPGYLCNFRTKELRKVPVNAVAFDYFPDEIAPGSSPRISLSTDNVDFAGYTDGTVSPQSIAINVENSGSNEEQLATVTLSGVPTWLEVTREGAGDSQTLTNTIKASALSQV